MWENNKKLPIALSILMPIFNFVAVLFVENASACIAGTNVIFLIVYYIKHKKIHKQVLINAVFSIAGTALIVFSPGNAIRKLTEPQMNIMEVLRNIRNFIEWTITRNNVIMILLCIIMTYISIKKLTQIKKVIVCIFTWSVPAFTIALNILHLFFPEKIMSLIIEVVEVQSEFILTYWGMFALLFAYMLFIFLDKEKRKRIAIYTTIALISNIVMMMSPVWGGRTAILTIYLLYITFFVIIEQFEISKSIEKVLLQVGCVILVIISAIYITAYTNVYVANKDREEIIRTQLIEGKETIGIIPFPWQLMHTNVPEAEFHVEEFKNYYNIPKETEIEILPSNWKWIMFYNKGEVK